MYSSAMMKNTPGARALNHVFAIAILASAIACSSDSSPVTPGPISRTYRMGFSNFPPAPDTALARRAVQMWTTRADAAIMHLDLPWTALLAGASSDSLVRADVLPLVTAYRSIGLAVVIETDITNGVDRSSEAPALVAAGRSITEDTVQQLYRRYVVSLATLAAPDYLGLASETNLIRVAGPAGVYPAAVRMTNAAASDVRNAGATTPLYVSVQVEVAWGRFGGGGTFVGIAQDRADFPFVNALGLSAYPYLGGFTDPSQIPGDYFSRLAGSPALPELVTEGGWTSANVVSVHSSPALQAAWIKRASSLLDSARAVAWFQITFTDINLSAFGRPDDPQIAPFVRIGLVDTVLTPKPALAVWDSVFARALHPASARNMGRRLSGAAQSAAIPRAPADNGPEHAQRP